MGLKDDLVTEVTDIFTRTWTKRDGRVVPDEDSVSLTNDAVTIQATVLYADLAESTVLVDTTTPDFAAEIYKAYLHCASKIIKAEGGELTAFDGDRVMAVFLSETKNTSAARCALQINCAVHHIINPGIIAAYPNSTYKVKQAVGIDTSPLLVAKTGIRARPSLGSALIEVRVPPAGN